MIKNLKEHGIFKGLEVEVMDSKDEETKLLRSDQEVFRFGLGSLLQLLKHSRPDISDCVREKSKVIDEANVLQQKTFTEKSGSLA
jgi:hypothetical protein